MYSMWNNYLFSLVSKYLSNFCKTVFFFRLMSLYACYCALSESSLLKNKTAVSETRAEPAHFPPRATALVPNTVKVKFSASPHPPPVRLSALRTEPEPQSVTWRSCVHSPQPEFTVFGCRRV